jgi:hypothetical protein
MRQKFIRAWSLLQFKDRIRISSLNYSTRYRIRARINKIPVPENCLTLLVIEFDQL